MARRPEWLIFVALAGALAAAALLGRAAAPNPALLDSRRSILLAGPDGAKGLAEALRRLGTPVEALREPLETLDSAPPSRLLVLLELPERLSAPDVRFLRRYVERGGRLLVAGWVPAEACFGAALASTGRDSLLVTATDRSWQLPPTHAFVVPVRRAGACAALVPAGADTLLRLPGGLPVAERLRFAGGGRITIVADARYVANRALRESDAGLMVIPWFLAGRPSGVVFDEYHQGFGEHGSLLGAAARWAAGAPAGWAMLQLAAACLVLLALAAVRFGPTVPGVERRRRSGMEHVEALAEGLERGRAADTAVALLATGLRRRLGKTAPGATRPEQAARWLDTLAAAAPEAGARAAAGRLAALARGAGGEDRVLAAGNAVEDAWTVLGQRPARARS